MPGQTEFNLKPWTERVGPDASIVHVSGGKRQINRDAKVVSQVPLPLDAGRTPFLTDMPVRNPETNVAVDTDALLWRTYRSVIKNPDDNRDHGKKVFHHKMPSSVFQHLLRKGLRDHMRHATEEAAALREEHLAERAKVRERHEQHAATEMAVFRERCKASGFEGLRRPWFRSPAPPPEVPAEKVDELMKVAQRFSGPGGKRMVTGFASMDNGRPFGMPLRSESEPMRRWDNKCFS